jgi:predicted nucleic acid-binding protein
MSQGLLIDTDVLVDYLRANDKAIDFLESQTQTLLISSLSIAELYVGVKNGKERVILDDFVEAFEVIPLTTAIAQKGGLYRRDYGKSHGVGLADALIAATAQIEDATLVTLNQKHFPMIQNILVPYRKS